jgi:serpin B
MNKNILLTAGIFAVAVIGGVYYFGSQIPPVEPPPVPIVEPIPTPTPPTAAPAPTVPITAATAAGINSVINANNQFALSLYSQLQRTPGNLFFSPYSISTALAMTFEGARGKTADEMQSVFHFPNDNSTRRASFAAIHDDINAPSASYQLSIANALWAQNDFTFLSDYLSVVQQFYSGAAMNVDFKNATEAARLQINQWVEDHTNNKIVNLFPQGSLDAQTRMVLTNAIYFKGTWVKQFDKNLTTNAPFRVSPTDTVSVPTMQRTDKDALYRYAETDTEQVLAMPYAGDKLSMLVVLPKSDSISSLESSLTLAKINDWRSQLIGKRVDVFMPKFTFDTKYFLSDTLSKMGMPTAFGNAADFSGMDGTKSLSIQNVIHQAFVAIDEAGTEAAAATGVSIGITSMPVNPPPIPVFRADHPFIFLIEDNTSGNILFIGRVSDPSK